MGRRVVEVALAIALFPVGAVSQQAAGMGPGGSLHPPRPLDTTLTRQQANQGRDAMIPPIKISFGKKSQEWTAEKLAALPHERMQVDDANEQTPQTYSGVPLIVLLMEVGVPEKLKGKDLRLYVVAEGKDGNRVVYSMGEVSPDEHEGEVLLVDSVDGKPLADGGPIALISSGERRHSRWVHGVVSIKVQLAD
ncbi:MAG TPA: hypothetical protein VGI45_09420 [Terracidiphilus sp.]|jgi:hypothetical protein